MHFCVIFAIIISGVIIGLEGADNRGGNLIRQAFRSLRVAHQDFCTESQTKDILRPIHKCDYPVASGLYYSGQRRPKIYHGSPSLWKQIIDQPDVFEILKFLMRNAWASILYPNIIYEHECPIKSPWGWFLADCIIEPYGRGWIGFKELTYRLRQGDVFLPTIEYVKMKCDQGFQDLGEFLYENFVLVVVNILQSQAIRLLEWTHRVTSAFSYLGSVMTMLFHFMSHSAQDMVLSTLQLMTFVGNVVVTFVHFHLQILKGLVLGLMSIAVGVTSSCLTVLMHFILSSLQLLILTPMQLLQYVLSSLYVSVKETVCTFLRSLYVVLMVDLPRQIDQWITLHWKALVSSLIEMWGNSVTYLLQVQTAGIQFLREDLRVMLQDFVWQILMNTKNFLQEYMIVLSFLSICWMMSLLIQWRRMKRVALRQAQEQTRVETQQQALLTTRRLLPPVPAPPPLATATAAAEEEEEEEEERKMEIRTTVWSHGPKERIKVMRAHGVCAHRVARESLMVSEEEEEEINAQTMTTSSSIRRRRNIFILPDMTSSTTPVVPPPGTAPPPITTTPPSSSSVRASMERALTMRIDHHLRSILIPFINTVLNFPLHPDAQKMRKRIGPALWDSMLEAYRQDYRVRRLQYRFPIQEDVDVSTLRYLLFPPYSTVPTRDFLCFFRALIRLER